MEESIKPDQLVEALTEIFSEYGNVIDLVAKKNLKAKGQAFVVFDDTEAAKRAIEEVQGFELFDKPMKLDYARTRSDATVQKEGGAEDFETHKRRRLAEKGMIRILQYFMRHTDTFVAREEASGRSCRNAEETQTTGSRSRPRHWRCPSSQGISRRWSQVLKSCSWSSHTRGIFAAEQNSLRTKSTRGIRGRRTHSHLW